MLRLGKVSYLNVYPLFAGIDIGPYEAPFIRWHADPPSTLLKLFSQNQLDVAFLSTPAWLENQDHVNALGNFGISSAEKVHSVTLFSKVPLNKLKGKSIFYTSESLASVQLLHILCNIFWKLNVSLHPLPSLQDTKDQIAYLLIGDKCLYHTPQKGTLSIDLAEAWFQETFLPFTFARLAYHKDLSKEQLREIEALKKVLTLSLEWSFKNLPLVIDHAKKHSGLSASFLLHYFQSLNYTLGAKEKKGIEFFSSLYNKSPFQEGALL